MKWTMGLFMLAAAGCGYGQTKMAACPPTGCGNEYAATSPQSLPATPPPPPTAPVDATTALPTQESDLPPERSPMIEALPDTPARPLPDRPLPPAVLPPNAP